MGNTIKISPLVTWSLWGHRDLVVRVHTGVSWGWYSACGVADVLQQKYGDMKASRRHPLPWDLYVLMMDYTLGAKQRKQRRSSLAQYRCYTYLRGGGKYEREKRRLPTALNCLYSSLYYMTFPCAVRRSSYVISRARSCPADDANCEKVVVPEGVREGMQGYQLRLETAPALLCRFRIIGVEL